MEEHPIQQPIRGIQIDTVAGHGPDGDGNAYWIGMGRVTRIEACQKSGLHANLPYVRIWADDECLAEFCQHNIVGVFFEALPPVPTAAEIARNSISSIPAPASATTASPSN